MRAIRVVPRWALFVLLALGLHSCTRSLWASPQFMLASAPTAPFTYANAATPNGAAAAQHMLHDRFAAVAE